MTSLIGLLFFIGLLSTTGLEFDCLRLDLGPNILFCRLGAIASFCDLLGMLSAGSLLKSSLFFLQQHIRNPVKFFWTHIYRKLPIICDSSVISGSMPSYSVDITSLMYLSASFWNCQLIEPWKTIGNSAYLRLSFIPWIVFLNQMIHSFSFHSLLLHYVCHGFTIGWIKKLHCQSNKMILN